MTPVRTTERPGAPAPTADAAPARPEVGGRPGLRRRRRRLPRPVVHLGRLLLVALVVEYLVVPELAGTRRAVRTLTRVDPLLLLAGAALEAAAIACYAQLGRRVLPPSSDPGFFRLLRIQLTTLSVSHTVPGGSAAGSSIGYRLMTAAGVDRADVGVALATQSLGSALVLNVIFWVALVVSIPVWGVSPLYLTAAAAAVLLVGFFVALVLLFTRGAERAGRIVARVAGRLPRVEAGEVVELFVGLGERMRTLGSQRGVLVRAVGWATANWLLDAASLYVFIGAFGHRVNLDGLLVSYGLANVLAALPVTPGGLGVVEATLTTTLVGFGTPQAAALLGVVAYRLVNFWLPIPAGGAAYLSLQVDPGPGRSRRRRRPALRRRSRGAGTMPRMIELGGLRRTRL